MWQRVLPTSTKGRDNIFSGQLTQVTGDEGIDLLIKDISGRKCIVQCKCYAEDQNISARDIREFFGAKVHADAEFGYFITTTNFSEQAKEFSKNKNIILVDGNRLKRLYLLAVKNQLEFDEYLKSRKDPIKFIAEALDGN